MATKVAETAAAASSPVAPEVEIAEELPPRPPFMSWSRTSTALLEFFERRMLAGVRTPYTMKHTPIKVTSSVGKFYDLEINTLTTNADDLKKPPLVLLHGMGGGIGLWTLNIDALSTRYRVYAIDLLGFGRSSRPQQLPKDPEAIEDLLVDTLEEWRQSVGLERFYLGGHSFGGYQAGLYALKHPDRVKHLVFVDPWGFPEPPTEKRALPLWARSALFVQSFLKHPLTLLRAAGPIGQHLITRARPDFEKRYAPHADRDTVFGYLYHLNTQTPAGEAMFAALSQGLGWAKRPFIQRVGTLHPDLPCTFIYGERSWMDRSMGQKTAILRGEAHVSVQFVPDAGHQVFSDNHSYFNDRMLAVLEAPVNPNAQDRPVTGVVLDTPGDDLQPQVSLV